MIKIFSGYFHQNTTNGIIQIPVAIKLYYAPKAMEQECNALYALAQGTENVEKFGIPALYYNGTAFDKYSIMATTLLERNLFAKLHEFDGLLPETILCIYDQLVS